jgi:hypothetical protein
LRENLGWLKRLGLFRFRVLMGVIGMRLRKNCQGNIVFRQPSAEVCQEFILLPNSRRGITLATEQCREPIKMGGQFG